jgi:hypothetical protein
LEAPGHVRQLHDASDFSRELVDDRLRDAGGSDHPLEGLGTVAWQGLADGRHVGSHGSLG